MTGWVMLLRGINVGGTGRLPMDDLKRLLGKLGAKRVRTYIQSGNVVFEGLVDAVVFEVIVADEIEHDHGFRPQVLVIAAEDFREIVAGYPYPDAMDEPKTGHVWFLTRPPVPDQAALAAAATDSERFTLTDTAFYLHAPRGIGTSKLATRVERLLGVPATARNLNTCTRLVKMLEALER